MAQPPSSPAGVSEPPAAAAANAVGAASAGGVQALLRAGHNEAFLRFVESVRDYAIFLLAPDGIIASWNGGAQRIKGYRAEEIIGRHFSVFYTADALARDWPRQALRRAAADGRVEDEGWRVRKDGTRFWANVVISAMRGDGGELLGYSKVTRDLTERRRHEDELREREENLRLVVDGVQDHAMFLLDPGGRIRSWNPGAERLLGHAEADVVGRDLAILDLHAAGRAQADLAAAQVGGIVRSEGWCRRRDGSRFWAESVLTLLRGTDGDVRGHVQVIRDLTQRRRVETLESEGRRIGEFIAMLSHELRNPLAPIRNALSILERLRPPADGAWALEVVARQLEHLTRLVDDLLDVSRVTSGKIRLDLEPLELGAVAAAAVQGVEAAARTRGHRLVVRAARPVHVAGDRTRLTQVIVNLLGNAIKYTPDGGDIVVSVDSDDDRLATLSVADTGVGMSAPLLQTAFEPFVQGERTLERSEGGLGIGLTLVRTLVELHGGKVAVASPGAGKGTVATIALPRSETPAAAPPAAEPVPPPPPPRRILVVDDNVDAADTLAALLRLTGHEVEVAYDGAQGLALAAASRPQVVLLDVGLPGMSGLEVARQLRALPGDPQMRVVAVTGYGQASDIEATRAAGFDFHLTKPAGLEALNRLLS